MIVYVYIIIVLCTIYRLSDFSDDVKPREREFILSGNPESYFKVWFPVPCLQPAGTSFTEPAQYLIRGTESGFRVKHGMTNVKGYRRFNPHIFYRVVKLHTLLCVSAPWLSFATTAHWYVAPGLRPDTVWVLQSVQPLSPFPPPPAPQEVRSIPVTIIITIKRAVFFLPAGSTD